mgnify:CR=1 FL=1
MIAKVVLNTLTLMRVKIGKVDKKELKGGNIMHIHTMDENYDYRMRRLRSEEHTSELQSQR